jgi:RNA polymerase sigma-70 factor (ECF subfamily)
MERNNVNDAGQEPAAVEDICPPAFSAEQVYHDYAPRVYHVARRMLSNDSDAEDVTQDVLLQVVRKLPGFRGESALPTWLHRITVNIALSHRRKRALREEHRLQDPFDRLLEDRQLARPERALLGPEAQVLSQELQRLIEEALSRLPAIYREVFVLADIQELPNAAIAELLGQSVPAIKSRLHRARQLLRQALAPHFAESQA